MTVNATKAILAAGKPAIGCSLAYGSELAAGEMAQAGYDWVMLDQQHGYWNEHNLRLGFLAVIQGGSTPVTRVLTNRYDLINKALESGALGLVIPMVNSVDEAAAAAAASRYPPRGTRSNASPFMTSTFGPGYASWIDDEVFLAVQIESQAAVENAEAILGVEGVNGCWIGPSDLALDMGLKVSDMGNHPRHDEAVAHVLDVCRSLGKAAGYACSTPEMGRRRIAEGFTFVNIGSDSGFISEGSARVLAEFKPD